MTLYQQTAASLVWQSELAGVEVHEPQTVLEVNLMWKEWDAAKAAQDDTLDYAIRKGLAINHKG